MQKVTVNTSTGVYDVVIGRELDFGELLLKVKHACHLCVVSDDTVFSLYGKKVVKSLENAGFTVDTYSFPHGEENKNIDTVSNILEFCAEKNLTRTDLMVALGGGVVGDVTGFCSAIYLRGIDFVQIPTTVLAAVDSSVGGKTGVDLKSGKNLAGAFHQPLGVFLDVNMFDSLPKETYSEGLAEAIKYGMIMDEGLFETFEKGNYDIANICRQCIEDKSKIVSEDEFDNGLRQILNFGHTPGHAIEKLSSFEVSHGCAVAIGMMIMAKASVKYKGLSQESVKRLKAVLQEAGLPTECPFGATEMAEAGQTDKKRRGNTLSLILIKKIGEAEIEQIDSEKLAEYY